MALCAPNILALGAGACGIELGIKLVLPKARIVGYVEREAFAAANLAAKIEEGVLDEAPIWSDAETFNGTAYRGLVDIVSVGLPCQPFSCAGKQRGVADERWLWPAVWRILCAVRPAYLFMEEVRGFVQSGFPVALRDLACNGWDAEWDLFSAAGVGAPHQRTRFFLLANNDGEGFDRKGLHLSEWRPPEAVSDIGGTSEAMGDAQGNGTRSRSLPIRDGAPFPSLAGPSSELADARSCGCDQRDGGSHAGESNAEGGGEELGDARYGSRSPEQRRQCQMPPSLSGESSKGVADSQCKRCGQMEPPRPWPGASSQSQRASSQLADPECSGLRQQSGRSCGTSRAEETEPRVCYPFPPGPGNIEAWRQVLEANPLLEPSVCRDAPWLANRVERLRLCGNGVIPLVAAVALVVLGKRLEEKC